MSVNGVWVREGEGGRGRVSVNGVWVKEGEGGTFNNYFKCQFLALSVSSRNRFDLSED